MKNSLVVLTAILLVTSVGCSGVRLATENGPRSLKLYPVLLEMINPYPHTLIVTDITPSATFASADIIIPPRSRSKAKLDLFLGRVYTISGYAVRGSEIVRFATQFSTAEVWQDSTNAADFGMERITLRLSNEQQGVVVNQSGRTIVAMTMETAENFLVRGISPNAAINITAAAPGFNLLVYFDDEDDKDYYLMQRIPVIVRPNQKIVDFRGNPISIIVRITPEDYRPDCRVCRVKKSSVEF